MSVCVMGCLGVIGSGVEVKGRPRRVKFVAKRMQGALRRYHPSTPPQPTVFALDWE